MFDKVMGGWGKTVQLHTHDIQPLIGGVKPMDTLDFTYGGFLTASQMLGEIPRAILFYYRHSINRQDEAFTYSNLVYDLTNLIRDNHPNNIGHIEGVAAPIEMFEYFLKKRRCLTEAIEGNIRLAMQGNTQAETDLALLGGLYRGIMKIADKHTYKLDAQRNEYDRVSTALDICLPATDEPAKDKKEYRALLENMREGLKTLKQRNPSNSRDFSF